jgi:hypothetical protein
MNKEQFQALAAEPKVLGVFAFLAAEHGHDSEFTIADGLTEKMGWPRRLLPAARARFLELGLIERIGRRGKTGPLNWTPFAGPRVVGFKV